MNLAPFLFVKSLESYLDLDFLIGFLPVGVERELCQIVTGPENVCFHEFLVEIEELAVFKACALEGVDDRLLVLFLLLLGELLDKLVHEVIERIGLMI